MLANEMKKSAKVTLRSFNRMDVFLYDAIVGKWCSWSEILQLVCLRG